MTEDFLAHSAKKGRPPQPYVKHIAGVSADAAKYATAAAHYNTVDNGRLLESAVQNAARFHDLGKLDSENQKALHEAGGKEQLPVHHSDAGVAYLKRTGVETLLSQMLIGCHHTELPDLCEEGKRGES